MGNHISLKNSSKVGIEIINNKHCEKRRNSFVSNIEKPECLMNCDEKIELISRIMMPLWYNTDPLTREELLYAKSIWIDIINNNVNNYKVQMKSGKIRGVSSCHEWFKKLYFERLYEVHSDSKYFFTNPDSENRFIDVFFKFAFTVLDDNNFKDKLFALAETHCRRGIKACEYHIIGQAMFTTLQKVLGSKYTFDLYTIWTKIFSIMLSVIIPVSVKYERSNNESQQLRFQNNKDSIKDKLLLVINTNINDTNKCPFGFKSNFSPTATTAISSTFSTPTTISTSSSFPLSLRYFNKSSKRVHDENFINVLPKL